MGNIIETFDDTTELTEDATGLKKLISESEITPQTERSILPHETQDGRDAAYSLIAYKNQNPDAISDLDLARRNFENKYQYFLDFYGQYSNNIILDTTGKPITYPVKDFFKNYPWRTPIPQPRV